jgi:hypothetical protein
MSTAPPGGNQPNQHRPTDEQRLIVKELYAVGIPRPRIAARLEISEETLTKHYKQELDDSKDGMISALGKNLYNDAINGDEKAREFWLKCQGRWSYAKAPEDVDKDKQTQTLMEKLIDKL